MNTLITSIVITVISGTILMAIEYWIIKPFAEKGNQSSDYSHYESIPNPQRHSGLAIASLAFGLIGVLSNVILPISVGLLGFEGAGFCCIPSLFISTIGLVLGLSTKHQSPNRFALSGIAASLIAIGIFFLFVIFLVIIDLNMLWCEVYPVIPGCP